MTSSEKSKNRVSDVKHVSEIRRTRTQTLCDINFFILAMCQSAADGIPMVMRTLRLENVRYITHFEEMRSGDLMWGAPSVKRHHESSNYRFQDLRREKTKFSVSAGMVYPDQKASPTSSSWRGGAPPRREDLALAARGQPHCGRRSRASVHARVGCVPWLFIWDIYDATWRVVITNVA